MRKVRGKDGPSRREARLSLTGSFHSDNGSHSIRADSSWGRERREGEGRKKDLRTPPPGLLHQGDTAAGLNASGIKTGELIGESWLYPY